MNKVKKIGSSLTVAVFSEIDANVSENKPVTTDVLKYWNDQKFRLPYMFELAMVVLAVPASQASVERLFSSMNFIYSSRRANLSQDNLEDILIIRANHCFNIESTMNI